MVASCNLKNWYACSIRALPLYWNEILLLVVIKLDHLAQQLDYTNVFSEYSIYKIINTELDQSLLIFCGMIDRVPTTDECSGQLGTVQSKEGLLYFYYLNEK